MTATGLRPPRWERRKESRPAELLSAALDEFVERGFAATRLADVAARAGVSKGTLYLYYESKAELFKAVIRENIVPLIEEARGRIERAEGSSAQLLERFFVEWWERFGATKLAGIAKLVIAESGNFPEVARFFALEVAAQDRQLLTSIIERGMASGEFIAIDADAAAESWIAPLVLKAVMRHSLEACCPDTLAVEPGRLVRAHLSLVLAALRPSAGATPAAAKVPPAARPGVAPAVPVPHPGTTA